MRRQKQRSLHKAIPAVNGAWQQKATGKSAISCDYEPSSDSNELRWRKLGFSFVKQAQYQQQGVIAFEKHQSAKRSIKTFQQLLKIVEVFPHYFAGIDADFEQNEHVYYQTGLQQFPLAEASISEYVELANYPLINAGMVNWPVATFRLEGPNASEVAQAANDILSNGKC